MRRPGAHIGAILARGQPTELVVAVAMAVCLLAASWGAQTCAAAPHDPETAPNATAATATAAAAATASSSDNLKLGVYMESLCPDTRRFFLNQLVPAQLSIGQAIDLRLVPFGHARTLGNNKMICQHGARECEGNRRMACLLVRSKNQTELVETFGCIFRLEEDAKACVARHMGQVNFDELEKCTTGDESYQLMVRAERESGKLGYVPHLTLNGVASEEIQDNAEHRLKEFLCQQYKGSQPLEGCKSLAPAESQAANEPS